jgi:hypothetical protein
MILEETVIVSMRSVSETSFFKNSVFFMMNSLKCE